MQKGEGKRRIRKSKRESKCDRSESYAVWHGMLKPAFLYKEHLLIKKIHANCWENAPAIYIPGK